MAELSPQAQAVLDALLNTPVNSRQLLDGKAPQIKLAAALQAAADRVAPEPDDIDKGSLSLAAIRNRYKVRDELLAIADELEAQ